MRLLRLLKLFDTNRSLHFKVVYLRLLLLRNYLIVALNILVLHSVIRDMSDDLVWRIYGFIAVFGRVGEIDRFLRGYIFWGLNKMLRFKLNMILRRLVCFDAIDMYILHINVISSPRSFRVGSKSYNLRLVFES